MSVSLGKDIVHAFPLFLIIFYLFSQVAMRLTIKTKQLRIKVPQIK